MMTEHAAVGTAPPGELGEGGAYEKTRRAPSLPRSRAVAAKPAAGLSSPRTTFQGDLNDVADHTWT
eukprot:SAG31_NODE_867_length_11367_cov_25.365992_1_plen_66_part_00